MQSKLEKSIIFTGLIFILLVSLVSLFITIQSNRKNLVNKNAQKVFWVTYNDTVLPFSLQMPSNWKSERYETKTTTVSLYDEAIPGGKRYYLRILLVDNPKKLSAENFALQNTDDKDHQPKYVGKISIGKNNRYIGWRVDQLFSYDSVTEKTFVEYSNKIYLLERLSKVDNDSYLDPITNYEISDQMISTLEFTN